MTTGVNLFIGFLSLVLVIRWAIKTIDPLLHWQTPRTRFYARRICLVSFVNLIWWALVPLGDAKYLEVYLVLGAATLIVFSVHVWMNPIRPLHSKFLDMWNVEEW